MSQQKGGSLVRDKLAGDVLVLPHSCYRYVRGRELHSFRTDSPYFETFPSYEYIRNTCNFTLVRATALSCFHFPDEEKGKAKRETQEERGGTGVLYRSCKAKIRASIRCFETIRTRVTRPHCGGKGRKKGKFHLFCDSLSRGAASSQRIPRAGEYEWREEGHRTAHFVISEGRGEGSSLEEEEEEEERRPCAESLKVWTRFRR